MTVCDQRHRSSRRAHASQDDSTWRCGAACRRCRVFGGGRGSSGADGVLTSFSAMNLHESQLFTPTTERENENILHVG